MKILILRLACRERATSTVPYEKKFLVGYYRSPLQKTGG